MRAVAFWGLCAIVFFVTWTGSYHLLPEGLLRGTSLAYFTPVETGDAERAFLRIFAWNLFIAGGITVIANMFRSVNTPLGYLVVLVSTVNGALVWGTGSLALGTGRIEPSLATVLGRSGTFELSAFVLIAVATREVMIWHQRSPPRWREDFERVRSPRDWTVSRRELVVLVAGIALLAVANFREASQIVAVTGY
ncbi:hypothetical protein [Natrinema halophilum]|uniref:hypothetical protein n=1 Tax=Natrinema halophilum TaxID=1699371 RepID=UPI001C52EC47|nr:hypothetical protein [Natrinema halophilum]QLG50619.2 hypothetical protein HYG82_18135 [Natrinema halophilum]